MIISSGLYSHILIIFTHLGYIRSMFFIFSDIRLVRQGLNLNEEMSNVCDVHFILSHAIYYGNYSYCMPFIVYGKFPQGLIWM